MIFQKPTQLSLPKQKHVHCYTAAHILALMLVVAFIHCAPRITRKVVKSGSRSHYLTYRVSPIPGIDTMIRVTLEVPTDAPTCEKFCIPRIVPGQYTIRNYGKYIHNLTMVSPQGDTLNHAFIDSTCFMLDSQQQVHRITYDVSHSHGAKTDSVPLFSGTLFSKKCWMINGYGVFGFFPSLQDKPIKLFLDIPVNWHLGTSLVLDSSGALYADNYYELQDSPILTGDITHSSFTYNDCNYFVYTYSDKSNINSRRLRKMVKSAVKDADNFMEGMNTNNYSFLFLFVDDELPSYGAHEHIRSSGYAMETKKMNVITRRLPMMLRHELFHTLSPLYLQSTEIANNNYITLQPISHLWFYEGLTQWATFKMGLLTNSSSTDTYLRILSNILHIQDVKEDTLSLMTLSQQTLENRPSLHSIYRRGQLFGSVLDMYIIAKTNGRTTLREVFLEMRKRYPPDKPFETDSLFDIIGSLSHPDVKEFCTDHIVHNRTLPLQSIFANIGIHYEERKPHPQIRSELGFIPASFKRPLPMIVGAIYNECKHFGFEQGDTLIEINGKYLNKNTLPIIMRTLLTSSPGTSYTAVVRRDGKQHIIRAETIRYYQRHVLRIDETADFRARKLRKVWMHR